MFGTNGLIARLPRLPLIVGMALFTGTVLPATAMLARQVDETSSAALQEDAPLTEEQAAATPSEPDPVLPLPGLQGVPAADPGPISPVTLQPPTPTAPPQPTPLPSPTATPLRNLTMRAEIDVFSGRPNPAWDLTAEETERLLTVFGQLRERQVSAIPASLGYRGLVLQGDAVRALGYERITVRRGVVQAEGSRGTRYLGDWDREFEAQIAATAQGRVDLSSFVEMLPVPTEVPRDPRLRSRPFERP